MPVFPQSTFPELADDWSNIVPEYAPINRARGAEIMDHDDILTADVDSDVIALGIDTTFVGDSAEFADDLIAAAFA